jgi:hypothetical protein
MSAAKFLALSFAVMMTMAPGAEAARTEVAVHVLSQDAKLIGSGVGGAWVTVADAGTGEVLAQGAHEGSTGDTRVIMRQQPQQRDTVLFDSEGAASFLAVFDIDEPTVIRITAVGPLGNPDAGMRASTDMLVTPGARVLGDGVVLTLHGLNIRILETGAAVAGKSMRLLVNVGMMCGCPLTPGGLWDADTVALTARLLREGEVVASAGLDYAGEASHFDGEITPPAAGAYTLEIIGEQPGKANFGRARAPLSVAP